MDRIHWFTTHSFLKILNQAKYYGVYIYIYNKKMAFIGKHRPVYRPGKTELKMHKYIFNSDLVTL